MCKNIIKFRNFRSDTWIWLFHCAVILDFTNLFTKINRHWCILFNSLNLAKYESPLQSQAFKEISLSQIWRDISMSKCMGGRWNHANTKMCHSENAEQKTTCVQNIYMNNILTKSLWRMSYHHGRQFCPLRVFGDQANSNTPSQFGISVLEKFVLSNQKVDYSKIFIYA